MTTVHAYTATQKTVDGSLEEGLEAGHRGPEHHPVVHRRREGGRARGFPRSRATLTGMSLRVPVTHGVRRST